MLSLHMQSREVSRYVAQAEVAKLRNDRCALGEVLDR